MSESNRCSSGSVFWAFILGGIVGAGITLLMAPQSGKEARDKIKDLASGVKDKTTDYVEHAKDSLKSTVNKGKDFFEGKKSLISTAIEAGKEAYEKEKNKEL